jgi:hypothetical protein
MDILSSRRETRLGRVEVIILAAYSLLVAWTVAHHVPWADEAQAWLLARDSSLHDLFQVNLHYEGSPGLWYLFLWVLCRMHVSYAAMHWLSAIIAVAGVWVFLRFSPFPLILRITLPFTFYLVYQYAVVARSYVAVPLLVFIAAALFSKPAQNLLALATVLGVLSNLCAQGFVLSAGFAFVLLILLWRERRQNSRFLNQKRMAVAFTILGAFWAAAIWTATPALDNNYLPPSQLSQRWEHLSSGTWASSHPGENVQSTTNLPGKPLEMRGRSTLQFVAAKLEQALTYGLSNSWVLSLVVLSIILAYLVSRRRLPDIAPYILLLMFIVLVVNRPWYLGLLFVALIAILWIDWPREEEQRKPVWTALLVFALLVIALEQGSWSVRAIAAEMRGNYSGDKQASIFLSNHISGKKVVGFQFWSVGVLPYFSSNIFVNQHKEGFWLWSKTNRVNDRVMETIQGRPDYIVIGFPIHSSDLGKKANGYSTTPDIFHPKIEEQILATGLYEETHRYCGDAFSGHDYHEGLCQAILEPSAH